MTEYEFGRPNKKKIPVRQTDENIYTYLSAKLSTDYTHCLSHLLIIFNSSSTGQNDMNKQLMFQYERRL